MASGQSEQSSVLQDELTCPVCLDLYRDPHLLPCGHNFCKACLDRLKRQGERGRFRCPECRESNRSSTNFQKNFKLANIADDYRHRRRAPAAAALKSRESHAASLSNAQARCVSAVPCDYCPPAAADACGVGASGDAPAVAVASMDGDDAKEDSASASAAVFAVKTCLKCEVSMCQEHIKPHLELPAFREHLLTEPMSDFWKRKCPDHDEIYKYYCMEDKVLVCNACTIEGGHLGHTIKTLKNTMKDLKSSLDKQLYRVERKYSMAEKKLHEQREKERQNGKFMDNSERCLTRLCDELKARTLRFTTRLREITRAHCDTNGSAIQKNISRIVQDQARLQEVRCGIESLMQENDPFRFIEAYKTTGKQCRTQLRKNMFYPEYVDMETEVLGVMMEEEMKKFINEELICHIDDVISSLCQFSGVEEEEEQGENEEEAADEDDEDDDDDLDDSSEEEMRSEGEEEEEEEEDDDEEGDIEEGQYHHLDDLYSPGYEEEEEEEEGEEEEDEHDDDDDEEDDGAAED